MSRCARTSAQLGELFFHSLACKKFAAKTPTRQVKATLKLAALAATDQLQEDARHCYPDMKVIV